MGSHPPPNDFTQLELRVRFLRFFFSSSADFSHHLFVCAAFTGSSPHYNSRIQRGNCPLPASCPPSSSSEQQAAGCGGRRSPVCCSRAHELLLALSLSPWIRHCSMSLCGWSMPRRNPIRGSAGRLPSRAFPDGAVSTALGCSRSVQRDGKLRGA